MRRAVWRGLVLTLIVCGLVPVTSGKSWACSCAAPTLKGAALDQAIARDAPLIFVGEVTSANANSSGHEYVVRVLQPVKGTVTEERRYTSGVGGGDCGVSLDYRQRLLVFTDSDRLMSCGGFFAESADDIARHVRVMKAALSESGRVSPTPASTTSSAAAQDPRTPSPSRGTGVPLFVVTAGMAAFAAAAVLVWLWRRRRSASD